MSDTTKEDKTDLEQYAVDLGKKIGFLIAGLNIPPEAKEAFMDIIEEFSLPQLEQLASVLETRFINEQTGQIEAELEEELLRIRKNYFEEENKLNEESAKKLQDLL